MGGLRYAFASLASQMLIAASFRAYLFTESRMLSMNAGSPSDGIIVKSLTVSPDPPVPGQDLVVKATGVANYDIEDGAWADVVVKLGLVKLLHRRFDVCEEARNANASIQCPIKEGTHEVTQVVALPKEIPRAKFTVDVNGYTADDDDLLCVKLKVDFLPNRRWFGLL
ncbi:unnamed protein product [Mycena citricolor]|uniref:Phosphatidylglycerol/phosphatidylinositol transfer protein n=1 Tax=Mycena citricolor TaxID=2018698 RepID=A0AAD2K7G8_9AGAR|nr:unnamed protein product [Mycena citricolor]CAK5282927.1 unnamed protein product [Mycena citricolor]